MRSAEKDRVVDFKAYRLEMVHTSLRTAICMSVSQILILSILNLFFGPKLGSTKISSVRLSVCGDCGVGLMFSKDDAN